MPARFTLNVNGRDCEVSAAPDTPLLYALRNDLGLKAQFGYDPLRRVMHRTTVRGSPPV